MSPEPDLTPEIVFTLGDPNGIGPEVLAKALVRLAANFRFQPVIFGSAHFFSSLLEDLGLGEVPENWRFRGSQEPGYPPNWGRIERVAGELARDSLEEAVRYCQKSRSSFLITAPIHKQAMHLVGFEYPGHTEFLKHRFGCKRTVMAFFSDKLKVALVTVHLPLKDVPSTLSSESVFQTARLMHQALVHCGLSKPRLALCGLNPHASEGGLFGTEEETVLKPAVVRFERELDATLAGPFPSDTLFYRALQGEFDGVIALYHDQGLIPIKLLAFDSSTNVTLGLPLIRTSPDHGTAFDIAGKDLADPGSMIASIEWALRLGRQT